MSENLKLTKKITVSKNESESGTHYVVQVQNEAGDLIAEQTKTDDNIAELTVKFTDDHVWFRFAEN